MLPTPAASVVLTDATIWAGAGAQPRSGWLWLENGQIKVVGDASLPPGVPTRSLAGMHILPGFVDAHRHFALESMFPLFIDASGWRTKAEALDAVEQACQANAASQSWVVFHSMDYTKWMRGWAPTRQELDAVSFGKAVLLADVTLHRGVLSSEALRRCHIDSMSAVGAVGDVDINRRGEPTGMVWEKAFGRVLTAMTQDIERNMSQDAGHGLFDQHAEKLLSEGYVHVHDIGLSGVQQRKLATQLVRTPLKISWSVASEHGLLEPSLYGTDEFVENPYAPKSVKFFLDGAHRCAVCLPIGALMRSTWSSAAKSFRHFSLNPLRMALEQTPQIRGGHLHLPYLRFGRSDELIRLAAPYFEQGYRLRIHALGNTAAVLAADAIERLGAGSMSAIEHIIALADDEIDQVARCGAVASLQPGFIPHYADAIEQQGVLAYLRPFPLKSLSRRGATVAISSDSPCGFGDDALHNLRRGVDRLTKAGQVFAPGEALSPYEAVAAATMGGSAAMGITSLGITDGQLADLTICDGDPFKPTSRVAETWISGQIAWKRPI